MSIVRPSLSWKAGAKVRGFAIQSKYICLFSTTFLKLFCNHLIDNDIVEYLFLL